MMVACVIAAAGAALFLGAVGVWIESWSPQLDPVATLRLCEPYERNTSDKTCIVDSDSLWLHGENLRLKDFDTPESRNNICGSLPEIKFAYAATDRLQALLNENAWTVETFGMDGTGKRRLATIRIDGEDIGNILIREGLARSWPDGEEFWCE